ncbi:MAG TPA: hypothetical protein P5307_27405 [Pirellulaceae bacterium]|nr:hypothetical protein [Pirellulaceae bacterium]
MRECEITALDLSRVLVLGCSCSGKSTFARELSSITGAPHIELDAINWGPNWTMRSSDELVAAASAVAETDQWIVDGCYFHLQPILWPRATAVVWLNYAFHTVGWRAIKRTLRRVATRERLYSGNRESFHRAFLSRDSILLWVANSYSVRRREIPQHLKRPEFRRLVIKEFKHPRETRRFLEVLANVNLSD